MKVKIVCKDCGRHEVRALFFAGGLAVTPYHCYGCKDHKNLCVVTHIDSGRKIGDPVSFERAKTALTRLLEITDWRRPQVEQEATTGPDRAWIKNARQIIDAFLKESEA